MRNMLFWRVLSSILVTVLVTLLVLSFTLVGFLRANGIEQKQELLREQARDVASMMSQRDATYLWSVTTNWDNVIRDKIRTIGESNDLSIWLVDRNGFVLSLSTDSETLAKRLKDEAVLEQLHRVMSGEEIQVQGLFAELGGQIVTVGVPWEDRFGDVGGAVLLHTDVSNLDVSFGAVGRQVIWAALAALVLGVALAYFITRSLTRPITKISRAVGKFAKGELDSRVEISRRDELGDLARAFNSMAEDLSQLEMVRRGFVANVSHELRSPMTSMQGYVQGMLDGTIPPEEHSKYLSVVLSETKRLNKLISELLDLSRIESGKFPLKYQKFDANELIARIMFQYEGRIEEKHISVDIDFRQQQCMVWADPDRISQVVVNLIDNAVKFLQDGGSLTVWTHIDEEHAIVTIKDDGPGIAADDLPYIFDRFYKADKAHSGRGTGLGLSIVKKILEQHGQDIRCNSAPGHGTAFIFTLAKYTPELEQRQREAEAQEAQKAAAQSAKSGALPDGGAQASTAQGASAQRASARDVPAQDGSDCSK
ncbi:MAG: ATP-binding protein [Candidatus Fimadaptatus sp.]|jgi:signal transduction histidine kinase